MNTDVDNLPNDANLLKQMLLERDKVITQQQRRLNFLEEQFRLAQHQRFGKSSEAHPGQGELFDEAEATVDGETSIEDETVAETEVGAHTRKQPKRQPLPKDLPREEVIIDIPEHEKQCACCEGQALHKIGEDRSEKLEFIPAKVYVKVIIRPKYACRACEKDGTKNFIKQAPMPKAVIPKGYATPSLLSQIITSKYQFGLPLHRQEAMFKQYGIDINRKTMSEWVLKCAKVLQVLYDKLKAIQLQQPQIYADETTLNVVSEDKSKCYMWLYATGADSPESKVKDSDIPHIVLFDYRNSRSARCASDYLGDYQGYLQVDGYAAYHHTQATLVGCWAHARRKFVEAKVAQNNKKSGKADWAINHIQKLYRIETQIKDKTIDERYQIRQQKSLPLLSQFKTWLDKSATQVLPKTKLGEAIQYSLNQWEKLQRFTLDGQLSVDNNRAERAIKPFVLGRKAWLFSQTANGAHASAVLYSIVETAKANGLIPVDYIRHILDKVVADDCNLDDLLPWNVKLG